MLRRRTFFISSAITTAALAGVPVYAYASQAPAAPSAARTSPTCVAHPGARHHHRARFGVSNAVVAKAAGTTVAGLRTGRRNGESIVAIAASHHVTRSALLASLDKTVDAKIAPLMSRDFAPVKGHHRGARLNIVLAPVAKSLGISPKVLRADLRKGQTLNQISAAAKVDPAKVLAALESKAHTMVMRRVSAVPKKVAAVSAH